MGMVMAMFPMVLMMFVLGGEPVHLLDFVDTESYWRLEGREVSVEMLVGELSPSPGPDMGGIAELIEGLGAERFEDREEATRRLRERGGDAEGALREASGHSDPEIAVRAARLVRDLPGEMADPLTHRLMVIRTLGELGDPAGVEVLRGVLDSEELFEREFAREALARVEGEPVRVSEFDPAVLEAARGVMPGGVGVLVQSRPVREGLGGIAEQGVFSLGGMGGPGEVDEVTRGLLEILARTGNIRLDALTFALSEVVGGEEGFAVFVLKGRMDAERLAGVMEEAGISSREVEGLRWWMLEGEHVAVHFEGDERVVLMGGAAWDELPVAEVSRRLQDAPEGPAYSEELQAMWAELPEDLTLRGVMRMSEAYRESAFLRPFDAFVLSGEQGEEAMILTLQGEGEDVEAVGEVAERVRGVWDDVLQMAGMFQGEGPDLLETLRGVEIEAAEGRLRIRGVLRENPGGMFFSLMFMGMRTARPVHDPIVPERIEGL